MTTPICKVISSIKRGMDKETFLPHYQAGFSSADAHGAGNTGGYSVAERLKVGAFHESDEIKAPRDCMNLFDHGTFEFHAWQFFHQILHPGRFGLDQNISLDHYQSPQDFARKPNFGLASGKSH